MIFDIADGKIEGVNWRKLKKIMRKKFVVLIDELTIDCCYGIDHYEFMFYGVPPIGTNKMIFSLSSPLTKWRKTDIISYKKYRKNFSCLKITRWHSVISREIKNVYQVFDSEKDYIKWKLGH